MDDMVYRVKVEKEWKKEPHLSYSSSHNMKRDISEDIQIHVLSAHLWLTLTKS